MEVNLGNRNPKAMVCGYFDGFHPGHLRFLQKASQHGELVVGVGSDERLRITKGAFPIFNESERLALVQGCRYVTKAFLLKQAEGPGGVVWEAELKRERPDAFIVNDEIPSSWLEVQRDVCRRHGVKFLVETRDVEEGHRAVSTNELRQRLYPYRICLTTGMDQVQLSSLAPGACVGFSIEATERFAERSGLATSTRNALVQAYGGRGLPTHLDHESLARVAFAIDNPPLYSTGVTPSFPFGSFAPRYITGSVDPITMIIPGVSLCEYSGESWPTITTLDDEATLNWLESITSLFQLPERPAGEHFELRPDLAIVREFAAATYGIWRAVKVRSLSGLQVAVNTACDLFGKICPTNFANGVCDAVAELRAKGAATCVQGSGGGGYIACFSDRPVGGVRIRLRRPASKPRPMESLEI